MFKNTLVAVFSLSIMSIYSSEEAYAAHDALSSLILKISTQSSVGETVLPLENKLLGRVSWEIKCQYNATDDVKACVMSKGSISVLHLNNQYIINVGNGHKKESMGLIRVDKNTDFLEREGLFRNANTLIDQFKRGNYAYTRFQPSQGAVVESKISLLGFTDAFNDMEAKFLKLGNEKL